jgi:sec-independent protein translocase protein TatA
MHSFFAIIPGMAGWSEIVLVLALALILFGPKRLPEIAEAAGKSIRKFKSATRNATDEVKREIDEVGRELKDDPPEEPERKNDNP